MREFYAQGVGSHVISHASIGCDFAIPNVEGRSKFFFFSVSSHVQNPWPPSPQLLLCLLRMWIPRRLKYSRSRNWVLCVFCDMRCPVGSPRAADSITIRCKRLMGTTYGYGRSRTFCPLFVALGYGGYCVLCSVRPMSSRCIHLPRSRMPCLAPPCDCSLAENRRIS